MSDLQIVCLFILFFFFTALTSIIYLLFYRKSMVDKKRYKLFAHRDALTNLVVQEKVTEDDWLYQCFYDLVNFLLRDIGRLSFRETIMAYSQVCSGAVGQARAKLHSEMEQADEEFQEIIVELTFTLNEIFMDNTPLLKFMVRAVHWKLSRLIPKKVKSLLLRLGILALLLDAYRMYRQNNVLHNEMVAVMSHATS